MKEKSVLEICFSSKYRCLEQAKKSRPILHFTQEFLTGGWIFFKTRRLPVLDVRECAYCVISDSAPRKEILACSNLQNRIMEIASLKDGDKEKMTRTRKYLGAFSDMLNI
ncbi:BBM_1a_G0052270.mRNA.1.CDS.1 [Saccharomyces cerevisiae]|nr:BBM_1a_G0043340.mRNA.1.CDS.1 [Saccharomyces cerevisiae]CAI4811973.1 BBM_1a_G0052270.mRNA.1.CDS.1 [Saccharomyces cerevisiae]CAI4820899.1 ADE_G0052100.mRNA.1.CDS.1 [Saccharomyces cerevisiae]CAI6894869.1 ADE_G0052100.mRNA.1.CDS.1 [Saccharomyces cerevisiae]CAI7288006.1 BBM_1a_G0043340.mRNA.1.CDS.1 [Saccharomyces cerevisiae]